MEYVEVKKPLKDSDVAASSRRTCSICGKIYPLSHFHKVGKGYYDYCKACELDVNRNRRKNKEALDDIMKRNAEELKSLKLKRLEDFDARDLILELKRRGYKGKLSYTKTYEMELESFN